MGEFKNISEAKSKVTNAAAHLQKKEDGKSGVAESGRAQISFLDNITDGKIQAKTNAITKPIISEVEQETDQAPEQLMLKESAPVFKAPFTEGIDSNSDANDPISISQPAVQRKVNGPIEDNVEIEEQKNNLDINRAEQKQIASSDDPPPIQAKTQEAFSSTKIGDQSQRDNVRSNYHMRNSVHTGTIQRKEEDEQLVQRKEAGNLGRGPPSGGFTQQLNQSKGGGVSMDNTTQSFMSSRFGADFSNVKIHNNSNSAAMSDAISAKAFTHQNHIYFNKGQYQPGSTAGKTLLAHELTHTIQQGAVNTGVQAKLKIGSPNDRFETEADQVAARIVRMSVPRENDLEATPYQSAKSELNVNNSNVEGERSPSLQSNDQQMPLLEELPASNQTSKQTVSRKLLNGNPRIQRKTWEKEEQYNSYSTKSPQIQRKVDVTNTQSNNAPVINMVSNRGPPNSISTDQTGEIRRGFWDDPLGSVGGALYDAASYVGDSLSAGITWLKGKLAEMAQAMPGYSLFCVVIGKDPISGMGVERNGRNFINAGLDIIPNGADYKKKLEEDGGMDKAVAWLDEQIGLLDFSLSDILFAFTNFVNSLGLSDIASPVAALNRGINIFKPYVTRVITFASSVALKLFEIVKQFAITALLGWIQDETPWYPIMSVIIGYDPITGEAVVRNGMNILKGFIALHPQGDEQLTQMQESGALLKAATWVDEAIIRVQNIIGGIREGAATMWNTFSISDFLQPIETFNKIYTLFSKPVSELIAFAIEVALMILKFIKDALIKRLIEYARTIPGYNLLTVILAKDLFSEEPVERSGENIIRGFMGLVPGGEDKFQELKQTGAIAEALAWISEAITELDLTWAALSGLFITAWASFSLQDIAAPLAAFTRLMDLFAAPLFRIVRFVSKVVIKIVEIALRIMGFPFELIGSIINNAATAFEEISNDPIKFLKNILKAVKLGFTQFFGNILTHLLNGVGEWLFGQIGDTGITIPKDFSFKSIIGLVFEILGVTKQKIFDKIKEKVGPEKWAKIENNVDRLTGIWTFINDIIERGPIVIWEKIQEQLTGLWDMVISAARNWIMTKIIEQVTIKLLSFLDPTGIMAIVNSFIAFFKAVQSAIEYMLPMLEMLNSFLGGVVQIAQGNIQPAANLLESTMARGMPIMIGFLANQVGLGRIGHKIREVIESIQEKVDAGIQWLVDKAWEIGASLLEFGSGIVDTVKSTLMGWWTATKKFIGNDGKEHTLFFQGEGNDSELWIASERRTFTDFIIETETEFNKVGATPEEVEALSAAKIIAGKIDELKIKVKKVDDVSEHTPEYETLLKELAAEVMHLMAYSENRMPVSTTPIYDGNPRTYGTSMTAAVISKLHQPGSGPRVTSPNWESLLKRRTQTGGGSYYVRGHLLNDNIGGPGTTWGNLTPLTQGANNRDADSHLRIIEQPLKDRIEDNRVFKYVINTNGDTYGLNRTALDFFNDPTNPDPYRLEKAEIVEAEAFVPKALYGTVEELNFDGSKKTTRVGDEEAPYHRNNVKVNNVVDQNPDKYFVSSGAVAPKTNQEVFLALKDKLETYYNTGDNNSKSLSAIYSAIGVYKSQGFEENNPKLREYWENELGGRVAAPSSDTTAQPKLKVGSPNDPMEHEADAMADQVMRKSSPEDELINRKPIGKAIQRLANDDSTPKVTSEFEQDLATTKGNGRPMDSGTQTFMESRFGANFEGVRIHTGANASNLNNQIQAKAFTTGNSIYFNEGQYNPQSDSGKHLLAHELTHTIQQGASNANKVQAKTNEDDIQRKGIRNTFEPEIEKGLLGTIQIQMEEFKKLEKGVDELVWVAGLDGFITFNPSTDPRVPDSDKIGLVQIVKVSNIETGAVNHIRDRYETASAEVETKNQPKEKIEEGFYADKNFANIQSGKEPHSKYYIDQGSEGKKKGVRRFINAKDPEKNYAIVEKHGKKKGVNTESAALTDAPSWSKSSEFKFETYAQSDKVNYGGVEWGFKIDGFVEGLGVRNLSNIPGTEMARPWVKIEPTKEKPIYTETATAKDALARFEKHGQTVVPKDEKVKVAPTPKPVQKVSPEQKVNPKLKVGKSNSKVELEADEKAAEVMRKPLDDNGKDTITDPKNNGLPVRIEEGEEEVDKRNIDLNSNITEIDTVEIAEDVDQTEEKEELEEEKSVVVNEIKNTVLIVDNESLLPVESGEIAGQEEVNPPKPVAKKKDNADVAAIMADQTDFVTKFKATQKIAKATKVNLSTENSKEYADSLATQTPTNYVYGLKQSGPTVKAVQEKEKSALKDALPEIQQPTGVPTKEAHSKSKIQKAANKKSKRIGEIKNDLPNLAPTGKKAGAKIPINSPQPPSSFFARMKSFRKLGKKGTAVDRKKEIKQSITKLPTSENIATSPGKQPKVDLSGQANPNKNRENELASEETVNKEKAKNLADSQIYKGEDDIYPEVELELLSPAIEIKPAAPHLALENEMPQVTEEIQLNFDKEAQAKLDADLAPEIAKNDAEFEKMESESEKEKNKTDKQINDETEKVRKEQEKGQATAKADVDKQRSDWQKENEDTKKDYAHKSEGAKKKVDEDIEQKTKEADTKVEEEYIKAEEKGDKEVEKTNKQAEEDKKKAKEESENKSWWDRAIDAIGDFFDKLKEALNTLFDELKAMVKGFIEAAKKLANAIIDMARDAIVNLIKGFGELLKGFVNIALAAFPKLRDKFNAAIDKAVNEAVDAVNKWAEDLKKAVSEFLDLLGAALDALLSAFQAFFTFLLDVLEFIAVGIIEVLRGLANLGLGAMEMPGNFWGQISEEFLGMDVTQPLAFEKSTPYGTSQVLSPANPTRGDPEVDHYISQDVYSAEDFIVDPVPNDFSFEEGIMAQIAALPEGGELPFGTNDQETMEHLEMPLVTSGESEVGAPSNFEGLEGILGGGQEAQTALPEELYGDTRAQVDWFIDYQNSQAPMDPNANSDGKQAATKGSMPQGMELLEPLTTSDRLHYIKEQMMSGLERKWEENKWTYIGIGALIVLGITVLAIATAGAIFALIPPALQIFAAIMLAQAMAKASGFFKDYITKGWEGNSVEAGKALARAIGILLVEIIFILLFDLSALLKVLKAGVKGGVKMGLQGTKNTVKAVGTGFKNVGKGFVKQGTKVVTGVKGIGKGITKGAKSLDEVAKRILKKGRFKGFKIVRNGRRFNLFASINPWVLLASGDLKEISEAEAKAKGLKLGDEVADGILISFKNTDDLAKSIGANTGDLTKALNKISKDKAVELMKLLEKANSPKNVAKIFKMLDDVKKVDADSLLDLISKYKMKTKGSSLSKALKMFDELGDMQRFTAIVRKVDNVDDFLNTLKQIKSINGVTTGISGYMTILKNIDQAYISKVVDFVQLFAKDAKSLETVLLFTNRLEELVMLFNRADLTKIAGFLSTTKGSLSELEFLLKWLNKFPVIPGSSLSSYVNTATGLTVDLRHIVGRHTIKGFEWIADNFKNGTSFFKKGKDYLLPSEVPALVDRALDVLRIAGELPKIGASQKKVILDGIEYVVGVELRGGKVVVGQFYPVVLIKDLRIDQLKAIGSLF